jgi:hypothetical protein
MCFMVSMGTLNKGFYSSSSDYIMFEFEIRSFNFFDFFTVAFGDYNYSSYSNRLSEIDFREGWEDFSADFLSFFIEAK